MPDLPAVRLHLAPFSDLERPTEPSASFFLAPLLHTLGVESGYQPRVFFDVVTNKSERDPLKDKVLRAACYNPDDESSMPYPLRGSWSPMGMYRRIWYAFRERTDEYMTRKKSKGLRLFFNEDGKWALTEVGVAVAAQIRPAFLAEDNVTRAWLEGWLTPSIYARVVRDLSLSSRLCRETKEDIHGHFAQYLASVIRNDTFRDRVIQGHPPTLRQIKEWTLNRAISAFRHRSRTPLGREVYGARTRDERISGQISVSAMAVSNFTKILQGGLDEGAEHTNPGSEVIVDITATDALEHQIAFNNVMDRFRSRVFRLFKPGAAERYERIYKWMVEGVVEAEIAEREGVSPNRAANLMAEVRSTLRKAAQATKDACKVIEYLQEEPYSTVEDLQEDLHLKTDVEFLLKVLVERGRVQTSRGSYTTTTQGVAFLGQFEAGASQDVALHLSL